MRSTGVDVTQDIGCFSVMERDNRTLAGKPVSEMRSGLIPTITRSQPLFHFMVSLWFSSTVRCLC